jgi:MFS family permease
MLNPVAMFIIANDLTEPCERARAIGVWGGVVGISLGFGPIVGGVLVETVGWRSIFWINIPVASPRSPSTPDPSPSRGRRGPGGWMPLISCCW